MLAKCLTKHAGVVEIESMCMEIARRRMQFPIICLGVMFIAA